MSIAINAGLRLWDIQKSQRTGLCVGIDLHYDGSNWARLLYGDFGQQNLARIVYRPLFADLSGVFHRHLGVPEFSPETINFFAGWIYYCISAIDVHWQEGIRLYKIQYSFPEQLPLVGQIVLKIICDHLHELATHDQTRAYVLLDRKAGDIDSTQLPVYRGYLSRSDQEVVPGIGGMYDFDTVTVTTWMGNDVLTPSLPFLKEGKGVIVVTRTSNPSGTTQQDPRILPSTVRLTDSQEPFRYNQDMADELGALLKGVQPTAQEVMLYTTTVFSKHYDLDTDGVSPIFSVIGSTMASGLNFRRIRGPGAVVLAPGFGHQEGRFDLLEALLVQEGILAGHWAIFAASRSMMYPWMKRYGGDDNSMNSANHIRRAIREFRMKERAAYEAATVDYPF